VELAARLAVLIACGVAGGALFVLVAAPGRSRARPPEPAPLAGLAPAALAAFILLAGGTALTGAGTIGAGIDPVVLQAAGIGLLAVAGLLAARSALRVLRATTAAEAAVVPSPMLLVVAWAGAALALASWILAAGAVGVALLAGVSVERSR
jgi:hypothetical protein